MAVGATGVFGVPVLEPAALACSIVIDLATILS